MTSLFQKLFGRKSKLNGNKPSPKEAHPEARPLAPGRSRARTHAAKKRPKHRHVPCLEVLERRTVFDVRFGFEVSGQDLLFAIYGTNIDDTMVLWSDTGRHYFTVRYVDEEGQQQVGGSLTSGEIALAEALTGTRFAGMKLVGEEGDDVLDTAGTAVKVFLEGGEGQDLLLGGAGADVLSGGEGDDRLVGGGGDDRLEGARGDDVLEGGDGVDLLLGGEGNDALAGDGGQDRLRGDLGDDLLRGDSQDAELLGGTGGETGLGDRLVFDGRLSTTGLVLENRDFERIVGSEFADWLDSSLYAGPAQGVVIDGLGGDDVLLGSGGPDTVSGGDGDDRIEGGGGADVLDAGVGSDTLSYERSPAAVIVDLQSGEVFGGDAGGDVFVSFENVIGSAFDDELTGNNGANVLRGMGGNDLLVGQRGDDTLLGGAGDDLLTGDFGNDLLHGGPGANSLNGGVGTDVLVLDAVRLDDVELFGGPGADTFLVVNAYTNTGDLDTQLAATVYAYLAGLRGEGLGDYSSSTDFVSFSVDNTYVPLLKAEDLVLSAATVDEGGGVRLRGTFREPGSTDPHRVRIDWGDGSAPTELLLPVGEFAFEAQHVYLDDDPTGSPVDVAAIEVTVSDPDTDSAVAETAVEVRNEAPSEPELRLSSASVGEGSAVSLSGTFADRGVLDSHRVFVNWGDGSVPTELPLQAGLFSFEAQHVYRDEPTGASGVGPYIISVYVADDDGGQGDTAQATVEVFNVAPTAPALSLEGSPAAEGSQLLLRGSFADPGVLDAHRVLIDWADGSAPTELLLPAGTLSFEARHVYLDEGSYQVSVRASDEVGGQSPQARITAEAFDVAATAPILSFQAPTQPGDPVVVTGSFADPGVLDAHRVLIDWGDSSAPEELLLPAGTLSFQARHVYLGNPASSGMVTQFVISASINDGDAASAVAGAPVQVRTPSRRLPPVMLAGSGQGGMVKSFGASLGELNSIVAYPGYSSAVRVASADVNGDGVFDVLTGTSVGADHVKVFDGRTGVLLSSFLAFGGFAGGIDVASGDVNGDGFGDVIVGAGPGTPGGHVKVFDGRTGAELMSFFSFQGFVGGVHVGSGDLNGDGFADVLVGAAVGSSHVKGFDARTGGLLTSFFAYAPALAGGIDVAGGDVDGDGLAEVITSAGAGMLSAVTVFRPSGNAKLALTPYDGFNLGVSVAAVDLDADGRAEIVTGPNHGAGPHLRRFVGLTGAVLTSFFAFDPASAVGTSVG